MLPIDEFARFTSTLTLAHDLADSGQAEEGYMPLLVGLRHAEKAPAEGRDWSKELLRRYREACDIFAEQYGLGKA